MGATELSISNAAPGKVSIHAPVMGATEITRIYRVRKSSFNPRARDGRDAMAGWIAIAGD